MKYLQDVLISNLNVTVNNGGFISIHPKTPWSIDLHTFNQNKFYCVTEGSCTITIQGKTYVGHKGDWFFIPANTPHCYEKDTSCVFEKYWMHFDVYPTSTDLFSLLELPYFVRADQEAMEIFELYAKTVDRSITDVLRIKSCALLLFAKYIELARKSQVSVKSSSDERLDDVLRYINDNLDKPISNEELARMCHLHPNHFIRFFKTNTGQTPSYYIKCRRMDTAKRLLEESDLNISEITERMGFEDISYFSKQFRSFYAMSPREYRKYYKFNSLPVEQQWKERK